MKIEFVKAEKKIGLPGLLANAVIIFDEDGPFGGLLLKGFTVWKSKKTDGLTVTFPSRPFHGKQYWLLRSVSEDDQTPIWRLRELIIKEYETWINKRL